MNRRIKNKISKRVINNILKGKPLSKFDAKYSASLETKILKKTNNCERIISGILNAQTIDVSNIHLVTPENHREIKTTVRGLTYSSTAFSTEEQLKTVVKSMKFIGSLISPKPLVDEEHSPSIVAMDQDNNIFTKKETKWQKAKGKLKGWFGR